MQYFYSLFGLSIRSEFCLPELNVAEPAPDADLVIRRAGLDFDLPGARYVNRHFQVKGREIRLTIPEIVRFHLHDGREILVDPAAAIPERQVNAYLLGTAMGLVCLQRGLLPLHANAVDIAGRAVAFAGASGIGKSTLAAAFLGAGHDVLTDDVCVLDFAQADAAPIVRPGFSRIRLWKESLHLVGESEQPLETVMPGMDKYCCRTPAGVTQLPLGALYILSGAAADAPMTIRRLHGGEAIEGVIAQTYRQDLLSLTSAFASRIRQAFALAAHVPVFAVSWPHDFTALPDHARRLRDHAAHDVLLAS